MHAPAVFRHCSLCRAQGLVEAVSFLSEVRDDCLVPDSDQVCYFGHQFERLGQKGVHDQQGVWEGGILVNTNSVRPNEARNVIHPRNHHVHLQVLTESDVGVGCGGRTRLDACVLPSGPANPAWISCRLGASLYSSDSALVSHERTGRTFWFLEPFLTYPCCVFEESSLVE